MAFYKSDDKQKMDLMSVLLEIKAQVESIGQRVAKIEKEIGMGDGTYKPAGWSKAYEVEDGWAVSKPNCNCIAHAVGCETVEEADPLDDIPPE